MGRLHLHASIIKWSTEQKHIQLYTCIIKYTLYSKNKITIIMYMYMAERDCLLEK